MHGRMDLNLTNLVVIASFDPLSITPWLPLSFGADTCMPIKNVGLFARQLLLSIYIELYGTSLSFRNLCLFSTDTPTMYPAVTRIQMDFDLTRPTLAVARYSQTT